MFFLNYSKILFKPFKMFRKKRNWEMEKLKTVAEEVELGLGWEERLETLNLLKFIIYYKSFHVLFTHS